MRKNAFVVLLATLSFTACKESFKKGAEGLEYKIISGKGSQKVEYANYLQMHIGQYYNNGKKDSLLNDTRNMGAVIELLDSVNTPKQYYNILRQLKKGDSLVIRILTDSAFKKNPESMPPFIKKGKYLTTTVKLINIFTDKAQADSAKNAEMALATERLKKTETDQLLKDDKAIKDYLEKNKIQAVKGAQGTYVQIIQPGTGPNIDTTVVVKTNYTGKTMAGKTFDSNTDPAFNHTQPFMVNMTQDPSLGGGVIKGWGDGLSLLNKGSKAKFYIPSSLAYGAQGAGADIPPYTILVFDIEVLDVLNKTQAKTAMDAEAKLAQAMQKRYSDSLTKANPQPSTTPAPIN